MAQIAHGSQRNRLQIRLSRHQAIRGTDQAGKGHRPSLRQDAAPTKSKNSRLRCKSGGYCDAAPIDPPGHGD